MIRLGAASACVGILLVCVAPMAALGQPSQAEPPPLEERAPQPGPYLTPLGPALTPTGTLFLPPFARPPAAPGEAPPRERGPILLRPSLTVTEEYNDNVFLSNRNKRSDFITGFTPELSFTLESAVYRVAAAYSFTAEVYAKETQLNEAMARQNLTLDTFYRLTPALRVSLVDVYSRDNNTNIASIEGISTGRTEGASNVLAPGLTWDLDPRTTLRVLASWSREWFDSSTANDSDTYRIEGIVDRRFTPRFTGSAGYELAYFDIDREDSTWIHTPRIGASYRFTPTLTGSVSAGPEVIVTDSSTTVRAAVRGDLTQSFSWGLAGLTYDRSTRAVGGLGGPSQTDSFLARVEATTLLRGLTLGVSTRYTSSDEDTTEVNAFNLAVQAAYQLTRWLSVVGAYSFFRQRSDGTQTTAVDVDQNRVFLGLQVAYPIRFD